MRKPHLALLLLALAAPAASDGVQIKLRSGEVKTGAIRGQVPFSQDLALYSGYGATLVPIAEIAATNDAPAAKDRETPAPMAVEDRAAPAPMPAKDALPRGADSSSIDRGRRFPCQAHLVAGDVFASELGKPSFKVNGVLVDAQGRPVAGEVVTLWSLSGEGVGLELNNVSLTNPESLTDKTGAFSLATGAINDDFNVVVGLVGTPNPGDVCSIFPVLRQGKPQLIRLSGPTAVVDLGTIVME